MGTSARLTAFLLVLVLLAGCLPRGETRTLQEVYSEAHSRFVAANPAQVPADLAQTVQSLAGKLESLASETSSDSVSGAHEIAQMLADLTPRAGYTSRPALGELAAQFRSFQEKSLRRESNVTARGKLLAARTYSLLAGELETTRFGL